MARVSHICATPLPSLVGMPWDDALRWYPDARKIYDETWGRGR